MSSAVQDLFPGWMMSDLANSGLGPGDVNARPAGPNEKHATNTPQGVEAYVLPYWDITGRPLPFYRLKLINNPDQRVKYKQLATSGNHVYFPKGFWDLAQRSRFILITEGEKKAACAVKNGIAACAVGGTYSWKNRTLVLGKDAQLGTDKNGKVTAKLAAGQEVIEKVDSTATGFQDLVNLAIDRSIPIVICFDSDYAHHRTGVSVDVQKAAAELGYELRFRGVKLVNIRQLILKGNNNGPEKLGLDDLIMEESLGIGAFWAQLNKVLEARQAFPRHPAPREYVNRKLQKSALPRSELQALSTAIISDLDTRGRRLYCPLDENYYFFDEGTRALVPVYFSSTMEFGQTPFGIKLYNDYSVSPGDQRLLLQLSTQFAAEEPIQTVKPEKVVTIRDNRLYYQLSTGQMAVTSSEGTKILSNGSDDILFEANQVAPIDGAALMEAIDELKKKPLENYWYTVMREVRIKESSHDYERKLLSLLFCISPWMYKWNNTQLPIEMTIGEAGSGKSSLYELRLNILTGDPKLRNAPRDMKDWTASVANTGGLHVTDNVHMTNGKLKQELSDELCRVITESNPHIESRKLYSDNTLVRTPVKAVFAVTAIQQPFGNTDIVQRSIITQLDKGIKHVRYDANWPEHQLERFGGRTHWVAFQLLFTQHLFKLIQEKWHTRYSAKYRLINVEQLLKLSAQVFGWESEWVPDFLEESRDQKIIEGDYALEGLLAWAEEARRSHKNLNGVLFKVSDITNWAAASEEFEGNNILTTSRMLSNYLKKSKNKVASIVGLVPAGRKIQNADAYYLGKEEG